MSSVKCPICHKNFLEINKSHLNRHGLTVLQYDATYPNNPRMSEKQKLKKIRYQSLTPEMSIKLKKSHTLEGYIEKYGHELGTIKFNTKTENVKNCKSLSSYIEKFGEVEGSKRYEKFQEMQKTKMTIDSFIANHGEILGRDKYRKFISSNKNSNGREYYQYKYGTENGNKKFEEKIRKQSEKMRKVPLSDLSEWNLYKFLVTKITRKNLRDCGGDLENFEKRGRGKGSYHVDHMVSTYECFQNRILPQICGSIHNLHVIKCEENSSKQHKSSIVFDDLCLEYYGSNS